MSRAISSVLDVTVFLLMIGVAMGTLTAGTAHHTAHDGNPAAETARVLATTTATISYPASPPTGSPVPQADTQTGQDSGREWKARGTLASHLATAAVGNVSADAIERRGDTRPFQEALRSTLRDRLDRPLDRTSVVAVWEPYPDAPLGGRFEIGATPPPGVDVRAATTDVGYTIPLANGVKKDREFSGYHEAASVLARVTVDGLFPPNRTERARRTSDVLTKRIETRYARFATAIGADNNVLRGRSAAEANAALAAVLRERFSVDLQRQYDEPSAITDAVITHRVRITVRTWSA